MSRLGVPHRLSNDGATPKVLRGDAAYLLSARMSSWLLGGVDGQK